jgi:hypothetical protein
LELAVVGVELATLLLLTTVLLGDGEREDLEDELLLLWVDEGGDASEWLVALSLCFALLNEFAESLDAAEVVEESEDDVRREAETIVFSKAADVFTVAPSVTTILLPSPTELSRTVEMLSLGVFCDAVVGPGELVGKSKDSGPDLMTARCLMVLPPVDDDELPTLSLEEEVFGFVGISLGNRDASRGFMVCPEDGDSLLETAGDE